jgi:flagellar hook protein FlgE
MLQALLAGVASIKAQQTRMNVIGNNLSNVNTTAYKSSRVTFQDMIAQTLRGATRPGEGLGGTNPVQFGLGVLVAGTDTSNEQGSLNATNRPTDLAVQGNGYFIVSNGDRVAYTRDGAFDLDAQGDLVHRATGERLLGWSADPNGNINTAEPVTNVSKLTVPLGVLTAVQATTRVTMAGNLSGTAIPTDNWFTQIRVYDALGGAHDVTIEFSNRQDPPAGTPPLPTGAVSSWEWRAWEGPAGTGTPIGNFGTAGNERIYFDANGAMVTSLSSGSFNQVTVPASTGTGSFAVDLDFSRIGQLKTETQVNAQNQNGFPAGSLQGFSIGGDGLITGLFTNGLTRPLGQIAMGIFANPGGLERTGNNLWRNTDNSGIAVVGTPRTGGRGAINSGFLEQSNVDIGNEFTDLIVTQRGFQANTRVVTTVDEMLQDLINMKR